MDSTIPDLDAPIVPGRSSAGILIGVEIGVLLAHVRPTAEHQLSGGVFRYELGPCVKVWSKHGVVNQVGVYTGYRGLLDGRIGMGSSITEVEEWSHCRVEEDESDNLVAVGKPGFCFDTEPWVGDRTLSSNRSPIINAIFVFPAHDQRL